MQSSKRKKILLLMETYHEATGIDCSAFDKNGKELFCSNRNKFCQKVFNRENLQEECRNSYIYGAYQAKKWGEPYIYYCPFGLTNWALPVMEGSQIDYVLTAGPVLMCEISDIVVKDIIKKNSIDDVGFEETKKLLKEIEIISPTRVRHLADLLKCIVENIMFVDQGLFNKRKKINKDRAEIADTIHKLKGGRIFYQEKYPLALEKELLSNIKLGRREAAQKVLNEILGIIFFKSSGDFTVIKTRAIELMVLLARAAIEVGADLELIFGLEYRYLEKINQVDDINQLSQNMTTVFDRFFDAIFSLKKIENRDIIFKAIDFIRLNYNKDINLEKVAEEVALSPAYFSKLFKEEMEISYSNYLNRIRIEKSKGFLKNSSLSLAEVALKTGFNDQSYFSRVFKKATGLSPGKWRKKS